MGLVLCSGYRLDYKNLLANAKHGNLLALSCTEKSTAYGGGIGNLAVLGVGFV